MTREGNIKDYQGNKIAPNTGTPQVTDVAKQQGLSQTLLNTPDKDALGYEAFSTVVAYSVGDIVYYDNKLYKFKANHAAGAWNAAHVDPYSIKDSIDALNSGKADKSTTYTKTEVDTALATKADKTETEAAIEDIEENYLKKGTYSADTAVGLADNIRGDVYADEQFAVRMTGGEANEVGGIGVVQVLKGAGAAIVQMFPEGIKIIIIYILSRTSRSVKSKQEKNWIFE